MTRIVDLRSDTITKPTQEMRNVMARAEVGDDVFEEDPTVNLLQEKVAQLCGKEAALFVTSGTMGNQISLKVHTQPGDEVILEENCHILNYEVGAPGLISGVQIRTIPGNRGVITAEQIQSVLRPENIHFAKQRLICIENTHNRGGGSIFPIEEIKKIHHVAQQNGLKMHLDGARLWNASVETGIPLKDYAAYFDSVSLCFSKGLGAPVGSIIVGEADFIREARRVRKALGGGMRQVGILAAAALYAMEHHLPLLKEDHKKAKDLAQFLAQLPYIKLDLDSVQTNIIIFNWEHPSLTTQEVQNRLEEKGVRFLAISKDRMRMVMHFQVTEEDVEFVKQQLEKFIQEIK